MQSFTSHELPALLTSIAFAAVPECFPPGQPDPDLTQCPAVREMHPRGSDGFQDSCPAPPMEEALGKHPAVHFNPGAKGSQSPPFPSAAFVSLRPAREEQHSPAGITQGIQVSRM